MSYEKVKFWLLTGEWPRDDPTHIFLARAIDRFGRALFANEWRGGQDVCEEPMLALARWRGDEERRANNILAEYRPETGRKRMVGSRGLPNDQRLTEEDWLAAEKTIQQINKEKAPAIGRFRRVQDEILTNAEVGKLVTAMRGKRGGEFSPIPASWWNIDDPSRRFFWCQINPNDPFGVGIGGDNFFQIFVTRGSLEACIRSLAPEIKQTITVERQCQHWLEQELSRSETESWPKKQFLAVATGKFGRALGTKMFLRAWEAAVQKPGNESRRRAGRKRT